MKNHLEKILLIILMFTFKTDPSSGQTNEHIESNSLLQFNPNRITFSKPIYIVVNGKKSNCHPAPLTLDGEKIYSITEDASKPQFNGNGSFYEYIFNAVKNEFKQLPDGNYRLNLFSFVIDKKGKLAYFDFDTVENAGNKFTVFSGYGNAGNNSMQTALANMIYGAIPKTDFSSSLNFATPIIPKTNKARIHRALYKALIKAPKFSPAKLGNENVNFLLDAVDYGFYNIIVVKNHQVHWIDLKGS
jgi:hypothetical protein